MAIQTVNLAVPNGDTPRSANTKINENFSNQTHAASRLVGTAAGNVMVVGAFGVGADSTISITTSNIETLPSGFYPMNSYAGAPFDYGTAFRVTGFGNRWVHNIFFAADEAIAPHIQTKINDRAITAPQPFLILGRNVTKDSNGFLKGASPVIDMYDNKIDLNNDAEQQGGITFEKLGVGDYLVKGSLGFAQDGWYIEMPKDANGNVLVAVVYEQLANNDLSIKTYAKRFDDETGDIVANLTKPRDIPTGRFISLRLHELPKEPPMMPMEV